MDGVASILNEATSALHGKHSLPLIIFLPRLDAWALEVAPDAQFDAPDWDDRINGRCMFSRLYFQAGCGMLKSKQAVHA